MSRKARWLAGGICFATGYALYLGLWWWRPSADCNVLQVLSGEQCPEGRLVSLLYAVAAMGTAGLLYVAGFRLARVVRGRRAAARDVTSDR